MKTRIDPRTKRSLLTPCFLAVALSLALLATANAGDGALYTMDNAAAGNHVLVFHRDAAGSLTGAGTVATGGTGTGAGLASQGSVLLSQDGAWVFVCNAGSSDISVLAVTPQGLALTDRVASGGRMPVSLSLRNNLLYVLNAGGLVGDKDNITAFAFADGNLAAVPGSTRALSADNTGPAQVSFDIDGDLLIVTERLTSLIDAFVLDHGGLTEGQKTFESAGITPFGFAMGRRNRLFISEAAGGAANASSVSSYKVSEEGDLSGLSPSAPTKQTAACWVIVLKNGRYVYTTNTGSGSISGFEIGHNGSLQLLTADGRTGVTGNGSKPVDMAQSDDGRFLYNLNTGNGTITAFQVKPDGTLAPLAAVGGIPAGAAGLAGR
jgi:6-phosphogluconolactonase (cycloisomerase 2 family)